ncbi:MAG TPA: SH3 domain-containing protein [Candidatus Saccharimonadales bacterium]|nr:SH3 domain-containing protein [Candidatus Saccharimonadales bacterium]
MNRARRIWRAWAALLLAALAVGPGALRAAPAPGAALRAEQAYQAGNQAYRAARFTDAVREYEAARATGLSAPQLEYNRANALLKSGQLGRAIAGYERARRMGLDDADLQASLRYARTLTRDPRPPDDTSRLARVAARVVERVSPELMFWIGWVCLALAAALAALRRAGARGRALGWAGVLLAVGLLVQAVAAARQLQARADLRAVIVGAEVPVRSGPGADFPAPFTLHEGTVVRVARTAGPWREIELSSDLAGWVPAGSLEDI